MLVAVWARVSFYIEFIVELKPVRTRAFFFGACMELSCVSFGRRVLDAAVSLSVCQWRGGELFSPAACELSAPYLLIDSE